MFNMVFLAASSDLKTFDFPIWIIAVLLLALLVIGLKPSKIGQWQEKPLSPENSKPIKGFCAIAIIIHHLAQELGEKAGILSCFSEFGVLFVGIFFFFSGYGLFSSLKYKKTYLKGFLKKRLVTVLVPFYICNIVFIITAFLNLQEFSVQYLIASLSGWILINPHMWYIIEIVVLYLAFYFIYRFIKNRAIATAVMSFFVLLMTIGCLLLGHGADYSSKYWFMGEWWYNTSFLFVIGILVAQNQDKLRSLARKFYILLLPLFAGLTVLFYFLTKFALENWSYWNEYPGYRGYKEKFMCLGIQLPWVIFFVMTVVLVMMKVKFGNPVSRYLGLISLELYLLHNLFLAGQKAGSINSSSVYITRTLILSIFLASIIFMLDSYIISFILKKLGIEMSGKAASTEDKDEKNGSEAVKDEYEDESFSDDELVLTASKTSISLVTEEEQIELESGRVHEENESKRINSEYNNRKWWVLSNRFTFLIYIFWIIPLLLIMNSIYCLIEQLYTNAIVYMAVAEILFVLSFVWLIISVKLNEKISKKPNRSNISSDKEVENSEEKSEENSDENSDDERKDKKSKNNKKKKNKKKKRK